MKKFQNVMTMTVVICPNYSILDQFFAIVGRANPSIKFSSNFSIDTFQP